MEIHGTPDPPIKFSELKVGDVFYFRGRFEHSDDGYYIKIKRYNHPQLDEAVNLQTGVVFQFMAEAQAIVPDSIEWDVNF